MNTFLENSITGSVNDSFNIDAFWEVAKTCSCADAYTAFDILSLRFNPDGSKRMTYQAMSTALKFSLERARQLVAKAFRRMRQHARYKKFSGETKQCPACLGTGFVSSDYQLPVAEHSKSMPINDYPISLRAMPIEYTGLSVRAYSCLKRGGIRTVGDVITTIAVGDDELLKVRNLGVVTLREIKTRIQELQNGVQS